MISVQIDEAKVLEIARERIAELIKEADTELVFWDSRELMKRTQMSWNFIQEQFFHDPRFPKRKVGTKWFFPARETRKFLEKWIDEQPRY